MRTISISEMTEVAGGQNKTELSAEITRKVEKLQDVLAAYSRASEVGASLSLSPDTLQQIDARQLAREEEIQDLSGQIQSMNAQLRSAQ